MKRKCGIITSRECRARAEAEAKSKVTARKAAKNMGMVITVAMVIAMKAGWVGADRVNSWPWVAWV